VKKKLLISAKASSTIRKTAAKGLGDQSPEIRQMRLQLHQWRTHRRATAIETIATGDLRHRRFPWVPVEEQYKLWLATMTTPRATGPAGRKAR
jgi:hypothetical protein